MLVRRFAAADLEGVFAIYDHEVRHGTATFDTEPYDAAARARWSERHVDARYPALVAVHPADGVVGYASLSPYSDRKAYARTAETSVYVSATHHRQGIGHALMVELLETARQLGLRVLLARITSESVPSLALHRALGFEEVGVLRQVGEKFGRLLDVTLLDLHL